VSFWHSAAGSSSPDARATRHEGSGETDISALLDMLGSVTDPRDRRGRQYPLGYVLAVCVVAMLAGAKTYSEIARHAADIPQSLLRKLGARWNWFKIRYAWPSMSVIWNVLTMIDAAELDRISGTWIAVHARKDEKGEWVLALDGKVMRGAWTGENGQVTLFSALLHDKAVTIAQVRVPDGTNEITQVDALLNAAEIPEGEAVLVTLDAAHTQRETAESIAGKPGWDYLMTVKGNQPALQRQVFDKILPLLREAPHDVVEERSRGRIKKWSCWITGAEGIDFPHASQAAVIRREVFEITGVRVSKEHALILTSRKSGKMTAGDVNRNTRSHWGIENKSHYIRDTVYREDHDQAWTGEGPQALASLHNLAIGMIRLKSKDGIKETTEWICRDRTRSLGFMAA
jgi:predicted transposase YbfD/YdcC